MTYRHLTTLATVLRAGGLTVVEIDGWKTRGRPMSTGNFAPVGVLWHHTGPGISGIQGARWMALNGRSDLPAPLCQLSIDRDGTVYVVAAGRANHAGKAKSSGTVASGDGNALYIGVECMNSGTEGWSTAQYRAMVKTGAALARMLGTSVNAQRAHKETSVTGKWDPGALDMNKFRADIAAAMKPAAPKSVAVKKAKKKRKGTRTLRIGDWNVLRGRKPAVVLAEVCRLVESEDLDVLTLQETNGYGDVLAKVPGYRLIRYTAAKEQGETCILVREGRKVTYPRAEQVTTTGWRTVTGGRTAPKWGTFARVEGCGFLSLHTAPTVQSAVKRLASPARWKSYAEMMASIRRLAPKMPAPLVIAADWNVDAKTDSGKLADFPRATLAKVGMSRAFPATGTHGAKRVIDGWGVKGVTVSGARALTGYGSDHKPVVATITY